MSGGDSEGNVIYDIMNAIFLPINLVLYDHSRGFRVRSSAEASHSVAVTIQLPTGEMKLEEHLSRIDRIWYFRRGENWIPFAFVEFKRKDAINASDWEPAIRGGEVVGKGMRMCRQGSKYLHSLDICHMSFHDGERGVYLKVGGSREDLYSSTPLAVRPGPAQARWVATPGEQRRYGYLFLVEALEYQLRRYGLL